MGQGPSDGCNTMPCPLVLFELQTLLPLWPVVMNCLGQAFWHQGMMAVIDGQLWEYAVIPLGRCKG